MGAGAADCAARRTPPSSARSRAGRSSARTSCGRYLIAYKDRSAPLGPAGWTRIAEDAPFIAPIAVSGRVVGGWTRTLEKHRVLITVAPLAPFTGASARAVRSAAGACAAFLGLNLAIS